MSLNISECNVLTINKNKSHKQIHSYSVCNADGSKIALDRVDSIKDLGVLVDDSLSFSDRIYEKIKLANMMMHY